MNGLDLFSGIGGISLALEPYVRTVAYCESDRYAQGVLLSRMRSGDINQAPIWDDVQTLRASFLPKIDIIFGGFPCQDISTAGRGEGLEGKRSGLFYEIIRLTKETNAPFVFLENVPAIRTRGLREVVRVFTHLGYDCRWTRVSARSVGACHLRERWFLLAYSNSTRHTWTGSAESEKWESDSITAWSGKAHASNALFKGLEGQNIESKKLSKPTGFNEWSSEPTILRRDYGLSNGVDRIRCLGNSVVPLQVRSAFEKLSGLKQ